ncbi:MAG: discoidin domain-containing protein [Candidatus Marinimicrobia bacterium]|nr:discoidin domain-containing protein [Candidatus Neomarinimicrobiota bacterium]
MKNIYKYIGLIIIILICNFLIAGNDTTTVTIFDDIGIHYGDESKYETDSVKVENMGNIIARTIELPEFQGPVKIIAHLIVKSYLHPSLTDGEEGDPWDRAGTVFLSVPGMENIELLKFITGFGGKSDLTHDVTNLAPLLQGETTIKALIGTYSSPAWQVNFELKYIPIDTLENSDWANGIYYETDLRRGDVTAEEPSRNVTIPQDQDRIELIYYTSGHSTEGDEYDEFHKRDNVIYIDGKEMYRYQPWRTDCENFEKQNPYSGSWSQGGRIVYSYEFSRSGWCPGDKVYPVVLDVTDELTPGEHKIQFAVENIGARTGYWRLSSYLSGLGNIENWQPSEIEITSSGANQIVMTETPVSIRIDLIDRYGNIVPFTNKTIKISSDSTFAKFSNNKNNWQNTLNVEIEHGSALVWLRSDKAGQIPVKVEEIDTENPLSAPDPIFINYSKPEFSDKINFALSATASADGECATSETAFHAIDGSLETKWCCNNGAPNWLKVELQDTTAIDYFVLYNAGAGQAPEGDPGHADNSGMNTQSYKIQRLNNGEWEDLIIEADNPTTTDGNICYHKLDQPIFMKTVRLYTDKPVTSRIYEFEIYNLDSTVTDIASDCNDCKGSPEKFELLQTYPNPFNSSTQIKFSIPNYGRVNVTIFDAQGRKIKSLLKGKLRKGVHSLVWNGKNEEGNSLSSGIYFISIKYYDQVKKYRSLRVARSTYLK